MLRKELRLRKDKDFKKVYRQGKKIYGSFFDLAYLRTPKGGPRIGIVISNKVVSSAVKRNKNKRIIRGKIKELEIVKSDLGIDVVVKLKKEIKKSDKGETTKELQALFNQIK